MLILAPVIPAPPVCPKPCAAAQTTLFSITARVQRIPLTGQGLPVLWTHSHWQPCTSKPSAAASAPFSMRSSNAPPRWASKVHPQTRAEADCK